MKKIVIIGPNGTYKSKALENIYERKRQMEVNVLFIRTENKINEELDNKKGYAYYEIDNFLKNLTNIEINVDDINGSLKNKIINIRKKTKDILNKKDELFRNDDQDVIQEIIERFKFNDKEQKIKINFFDLIKFTPAKYREMSGGSGQKFYTLLRTITFLSEILNVPNNKNCLIIDEPEKFCHPNLILKIANKLKKISEKVEIYLTTHSPFFLNNFFENKKNEELYLSKNFNKAAEKELLKSSDYLKNEKFFQKLPVDIKFKNKNLMSYPIFSFNFYQSLFANKIILVEGISEKLLMSIIIKDLSQNEINENIYVFITFGKDNLFETAKWFNDQNFSKIFALCDSDKDDIKDIENKINKYTPDYYVFKENFEKAFNITKNNKSTPEWYLDNEKIKQIKAKKNGPYEKLLKKIKNFVNG